MDPIKKRTLMDLTKIVSDPSLISFSQTSLQSETALSCQNVISGEKTVTQLNPRNPTFRAQNRMAAELVVPHPKKNILAVKGGQLLQIYDLDLQAKLKSTKMTENIEFMKWVDEKTLVLVSSSNVFEWGLDSESSPEVLFVRLSQLAGWNISNFRTDGKRVWCLLLASSVDQTTGKLIGSMQIYNREKKKSQYVPAHTGMYVEAVLEGQTEKSTLFCMAAGTKLLMNEVSPVAAGATALRASADIIYTDPNDFPVAIEYSERYGLILLISAMGILSAFEIGTATLVVMSKVSTSLIFTSVSERTEDGLIGVNVQGQVLQIGVDEHAIVPYITQKLQNVPLAVRIAGRAKLSGCEDLFIQQFEANFLAQNYGEAAKMAAIAPGGVLRTPQTIQRFKTALPIGGGAPPLMQYLAVLLERTRLNEQESLELVGPVVQQGRKDMAEGWLRDGKITASEPLGNFLRTVDLNFALSAYLSCGAHEKAVQTYAELGELDKLIAYCKQTGYRAPYGDLLRGLCQVKGEWAEQFALKLIQNPEGALIETNEAMEIMFQKELIKELTGLMLEVLKADLPEQSRLQTRFLEILLLRRPDIANVIFGRSLFHEYDQSYIGGCCETAGLFHRALEHYTELADIIRCIAHTDQIPAEFIVGYVGEISKQKEPKYGYECLRVLSRSKNNVRLCTDIANSWAGKVLDRREIIHIFEENKMVEAVYLHLQSIASTLEENDLVFSFVRAAVQMQQLKEVEIVVRDSTHYDAVEVRDFLMEKNLPDSKALMILCDKHNFVHELIRYLWNGRQTNAIEQYVSGLSPRSIPAVVGALLDLDAEESFISSLLHLVKSGFDISALVEATENRGRLALLRSFLEARVSEDNSTEPALHTALAKIYVDQNPQGAAEFITANEYYDAHIVGHYCERRNGDLALLCYRKRQCDDELLALTTRDELFREQAQYVMSRKDKDLWARVLKEDNPARAKLIVQVKFDAIRTCQDVGEVSAVVKAFAFAELTADLIELLDTILFTNQIFADNQFLQNLLLVTAIKEHSTELRRYIHRLNNYKAADIAQTALANGLTEEAFEIYAKANMHKDAVGTLLDKIDDIDRAVAYAKQVNSSECYVLVARGQIQRDLIADAIESYLRADDPADFALVIEKTKKADLFAPLVKFLLMARQKLKEEVVDSALVYSYARLNQLAELEEAINMPSKAKLDQVGEQCFQEGLLQAARSIFSHLGNHKRLASTCIRLRQYQEAVEAAKLAQKNASGVETWREVCFACVDAQQFRLAQQCGVNVVMREEELPGLVKYYVDRGYFDEVIALMEQAMRRENSHKGIYTELGSLYSNFREEKLLEHIKLFHKHIILPQLMLVCRQNEQWSAVCLLQTHKGDHQDAAYTMIDHADAWTHSAFKEAMSRVSSKGAVNRAIDFYIDQHPRLLNELLTAIGENVDHGDLVWRLRKRGLLMLARSYLLIVQEQSKQEIKDVNEAVVEILLEEESVDELRRIVENYPTFDQLGLAAKLEGHPLLALRRLGSWVYTLNKRFQSAVGIAKKDRMYEDAMSAAAMSGESGLAEELLRYFALDKDIKSNERPGCFAACTYRCYDILSPDVVMELAWRAKLEEYAMPYKIQSTREYTTKIDDIGIEIAKINAELEQNKKISAAEKNLAPGPSSVPLQSQSQINLQLSSQNVPPSPNQYVPMGIQGMMGVSMAPGYVAGPSYTPQLGPGYVMGQTQMPPGFPFPH